MKTEDIEYSNDFSFDKTINTPVHNQNKKFLRPNPFENVLFLTSEEVDIKLCKTRDDSDISSPKMNGYASPLVYKINPSVKFANTGDRVKESKDDGISTNDQSDFESKLNETTKVKFAFNWAQCNKFEISDDEDDN